MSLRTSTNTTGNLSNPIFQTLPLSACWHYFQSHSSTPSSCAISFNSFIQGTVSVRPIVSLSPPKYLMICNVIKSTVHFLFLFHLADTVSLIYMLNILVWKEWLIPQARFCEFVSASCEADARLMKCFILVGKKE